ncbi:MAG: hypothetical protein AB8B62_12180 [Roseobacter sp.]
MMVTFCVSRKCGCAVLKLGLPLTIYARHKCLTICSLLAIVRTGPTQIKYWGNNVNTLMCQYILLVSYTGRRRRRAVSDTKAMFQEMNFRSVCLVAFVAFSASACTNPHYSQELEEIGARSDLSSVLSADLCDAASYFTYNASSGERGIAKRLLAEVLNRGDISRKDYNSALTGDVELGMAHLAATCA